MSSFMVLMPLGVMSFLVGIVLMQVSRERTIDPGHCEGCAYDMRGAPSPCCPECGHTNGMSAQPRSNGLRTVFYVIGFALVCSPILPLLWAVISICIFVTR